MKLDQIPIQSFRLRQPVHGDQVRHQWQTLPPLSLYIHIPWCVQKCPYCDFNSHQQDQATVSMDDYLTTLIQDLDQQLPYVWGRPLHSIFIGGGTPSLMTPEQVDGLLSQVRSRLPFNDRTEVTLEANPGAVDSRHFVGYRQAGVTRMSLGVQSFHAPHLQALGRIHSAEDAHQAIVAIQAAGFQRWNVDLMFGLPQQTVAQGLNDVDALLAYEPGHVSYYQLTLEPNTPFYRSPPPLPTDDTIMDLQAATMERWQSAGLQSYEVSAFAKQGQHSQHNTNYWLFGDYLGIGAGAHGKLSFANDGRLCRTQHVAAPGAYVAAVRQAATASFQNMATIQRDVSVADTVFEYALNVVRLKQGVEWSHFERVTGLPVALLQQKAQWAQEQGLLATSSTHFVTTALGWAHLNDVQASFLAG